MTYEKCDRCDITSDKVILYDVIYEGKMALLCERCSIIENIPLLKKPDNLIVNDKVNKSESYDRLKKISGIKPFVSSVSLSREERLKALEKNPVLEYPIKKQLNLLPHYHWEIMKHRRRKGLSHKQLGEAIHENEVVLEMLEKGKFSDASENTIKKLEQFFQINLRNISESDVIAKRKELQVRNRPVLLDERGNILENIPEPEIDNDEVIDIEEYEKEINKNQKEIPWYKKILGRKKRKEEPIQEEVMPDERKKEVDIDEKELEMNSSLGSRYLEYRRKEFIHNHSNAKSEKIEGYPKEDIEKLKNKDLDINNVDINKMRISDLKEIHNYRFNNIKNEIPKRKIEATKQEKIEEQRKIEDKQRLIEAKKEELRLLKEKESKNIDDNLGGSELLFKRKEDDFNDSVRDFI